MTKIEKLKITDLVRWNLNDEKIIARYVQSYMDILYIDEDGKVKTQKKFRLDAYLKILATSIELYDITAMETKKNLLFRTGFLRLKKYKTQTLNDFRRALATEVRRYLKRPIKHYIILFPLPAIFESVTNGTEDQLVVKTWEETRKNLEIDEFIKKWSYHTTKLDPKKADLFSNFTPILVHTEGQDLDGAFRQADENFDWFRWLLNLHYSFGRNQMQISTARPLAYILPPPIYGVFSEDGTYETYYFHTQPYFEYPGRRIITNEQLQKTGELAKKLQKSKENNSTDRLLVEAIKKYGAALDTSEWRLAFLELWQILELITLQSHEQLNMKQVVNRINCLLGQDFFARDLLLALYKTRNELVHQGHFPEREGLEEVNLLKHIVERSIDMLLTLLEKFPTQSSLLKFYDYASIGDRELAERVKVISLIQTSRDRSTR